VHGLSLLRLAARRVYAPRDFGGGPGVRGRTVRTWLDVLLPLDAHERCRGKVHVLVTRLKLRGVLSSVVKGWPTPLARERVSDFRDRADLIDALMASVHIPLFMDGKFFAEFRGAKYIDGSFLAAPGDLALPAPPSTPPLSPASLIDSKDGTASKEGGLFECPVLVLPGVLVDHKLDPGLQGGGFVKLQPGPELVRALMRQGAAFARASEFRGAGVHVPAGSAHAKADT